MKNLLIAAVCFTAIFSMSSCTDDSAVDTNNESSSVSTEKKFDIKAGGDNPVAPPKK